MKVLVACEFSGIVRDAFLVKGHDAWSCDLLPTEKEGPHIQDDVLKHLDDGWDLMIGHPPCSYLSNAGARFLYPNGKLNEDRFRFGLLAKDFFLELLIAPVEKICLENPVPSTIYNLPPYDQIIEPYNFGHQVRKKTCLWLKNLPPLFVFYTGSISPLQSTKIPGNWFNKGGRERQKNRARTFPGIAQAMAEQWGKDNDNG